MHYKKFDSEFQSQLQKQKDELTGQHQLELEKTREDMRLFGITQSEAELRKKLLVFSQFLRCAAAKRSSDEDMEAEENRAFEGALLLVYGGDEKAVSAAMKLIDGSDERVPSIDGVELGFTCEYHPTSRLPSHTTPHVLTYRSYNLTLLTLPPHRLPNQASINRPRSFPSGRELGRLGCRSKRYRYSNAGSRGRELSAWIRSDNCLCWSD